jgi:hypothetical protein
LFLDRAGWRGTTALQVPDCVTLVPPPADWPELNPVERIREYLKERYLSHRLLDAIVDAASRAWNKLSAETGRLTSLTWLPWAPENGASQNL